MLSKHTKLIFLMAVSTPLTRPFNPTVQMEEYVDCIGVEQQTSYLERLTGKQIIFK